MVNGSIGITYAEIQHQLKVQSQKIDKLAKIQVVVLRNVTVEPMEPYLRYLGADIGYNIILSFGQYDNVVQESMGGETVPITGETDYVMVFLSMETLSARLVRRFVEMKMEDIEKEIDGIQSQLSTILFGIRKQTDAVILWHSFESLPYPSLGILDNQRADGQNACILRLNNFMKGLLSNDGNANWVDLNICRARLGEDRYYDRRMWYIGKCPYTLEAMETIALENFKIIRALKGKNRKCLVLDCDNTLWGGVVAEDGLSGIKLGTTYPGTAFVDFQNEIVNLIQRGVIICLCSKNNEEDVWEAFEEHPEMVLKREQIACAQINWDDKATNLQRISEQLNISLDGMVFMDDSEFEIELVSKMLADVKTILLPKDRVYDYTMLLSSCGYFDSLSFSEEDKIRTDMYKTERKRQEVKSHYADLTDYLKSLEIKVEIRYAQPEYIARLAQLTQRTNQFNLTTIRYTEDDIAGMLEKTSVMVIQLKLKDRFGDMGLVGLAILMPCSNDTIGINTLLLSCRVLGRGVEKAFLHCCIEEAYAKGWKVVEGRFVPSRKNGQTKEFYRKGGFRTKRETNGETVFEHCRKDKLPGIPEHLLRVVSVSGKDLAAI
jgi:FkbH-like protein